MAVNCTGVYFGIREGAGSMLKNKLPEGKSIVNFSSVAGFMGGTPFAYVRFFRLLKKKQLNGGGSGCN